MLLLTTNGFFVQSGSRIQQQSGVYEIIVSRVRVYPSFITIFIFFCPQYGLELFRVFFSPAI